MNYVITEHGGAIAPLGDKAPAKGDEVFSDAKSLQEAVQAAKERFTKGITLSAYILTLYCSIPGAPDVKKFENVDKGLARILKYTVDAKDQPVPVKAAKAAKPASKPKTKAKGKAAAAAVGGAPKAGSKKAQIINMLAVGATREQIMEVTGWQAHSVRGFLSTLGKKQTIQTAKNAKDELVYKIG